MYRTGRPLLALLVAVLGACSPRSQSASSSASAATASDMPVAASAAPAATAARAAAVHANELGAIPVLEYHQIGPGEARWRRTPEHLRADLERLYRAGYVLTSLHEIVANRISTPAGKKPVALTFDDATEGQFRYLPDGTTIDPACAVGVIEAFAKAHPDGGKAATFFVLPESAFGPQAFAKQKLTWLIANGYEVGNHTIRHDGLSTLTDARVDHEIGGALDLIHRSIPGYAVHTLAYPYGMVPKNLAIVAKYHTAAFLVGAEPTVSPLSKFWTPLKIPRIQAIDSEFQRHHLFDTSGAAYRYVSDGDPAHYSIPATLPPGLAATLAPKYANDPALIRYEAAPPAKP